MNVDRFGRLITDHGDNTFSVTGITISGQSISAAINTFNSMAPDDCVPPIVQQPLDSIGVFATLNAVLGVWSLQDAANAAGLDPDQLVAEALAWSIAQGGFSGN